MAVKYLNDTYGEQSSTNIIKNIARGVSIFDAIQDETGISYNKFRDDFTNWVENLKNPERDELKKLSEEKLAIKVLKKQAKVARRKLEQFSLGFMVGVSQTEASKVSL